MTNVEALKDLAAAIIGGTMTADNVPGKTTAEVIAYIASVKRGEYLQELSVTSVAGTTEGKTAIAVSPTIESGNSYVYVDSVSAISIPEYLETVTGTAWNGTDEIEIEDEHRIGIYEINSDGGVVKFGQTITDINLG